MSGVSAIGSAGGYSSYGSYATVSGGGAFTSAAQDAAGLAIDKKTETQTRELDQGKENLKDAKSMLNVEDGALDGITDYLQNIRELALRAGNATMSDEDKQYIQGQIDQYLQGIDDIAKQTTFNEQPDPDISGQPGAAVPWMFPPATAPLQALDFQALALQVGTSASRTSMMPWRQFRIPGQQPVPRPTGLTTLQAITAGHPWNSMASGWTAMRRDPLMLSRTSSPSRLGISTR